MSDINVTPMIDVMLVLLVIFMVTAPLLTFGVKVDLPKTEASAIADQEEPLTVSIKRDGSVCIGDICVDGETLISKLLAITNNNTTVRLYLQADRTLKYEDVMQVIAMLDNAGFKKIALISDMPDKPVKGKALK
jgi:biopolymer transport protein TolR